MKVSKWDTLAKEEHRRSDPPGRRGLGSLRGSTCVGLSPRSLSSVVVSAAVGTVAVGVGRLRSPSVEEVVGHTDAIAEEPAASAVEAGTSEADHNCMLPLAWETAEEEDANPEGESPDAGGTTNPAECRDTDSSREESEDIQPNLPSLIRAGWARIQGPRSRG